METYTEFIGKFEEISHPYINCEILNNLKEDFKHIINSKRVSEKIINIGTLLRVLEKRGVLQYDEISILKCIAQQFVKNEFTKELILKYEQWLKENSSKINHFYTCGAITKPSINQLELQMPNLSHQTEYYATTPISHMTHEKKLQELIINKVGKKIGKYWADVCRKLNLEESIVEEIEIKYFNKKNRFEQMFNEGLNFYFSEHHLKWKTDLMQALESSRRKDLKEMVEEILSQYNF